MRKLLVRERVFAIGAKFDISDENGNSVFLVEADKFDIGKNIHVYSPNKNREYYYLQQVIRLGAHKYRVINENKNEIGIVEKVFMSPEYTLNSSIGNFTMVGKNLWGRTYEIKRNSIVVGKFTKPITFITDYYEVEIYNEENMPLIIGLVILIDMVRFHNNN
ncbi:hypothetical protein [uncultured Clostridium sp.]|uniref:LURP-one-related/scramblase family protein n=1 Tax=uncultured Clostridium sp. TaxID=59620 RepID=UPI00260A1DB4|nr:hypothetical protein [uncultured Clostridium sp.]